MKNKSFLAPTIAFVGSMIFSSFALHICLNTDKASVAKADTGTVSTSLSAIYNACPSSPDSNYYKLLVKDTDYPLGDGTIVNMRVTNGGANSNPKVRNYHNEGTNYYIYIKYNSTHTAVGQLGGELIFNASDCYLLDSVVLHNGYQINDAFKIQTYDQSTGTYVDEVTDQMFSKSGANYNYTFNSPTSSFKIIHYLHSTSAHNEIAWKETDVSYETANSLIFDSQGGTDIKTQTYAVGSSDKTFKPDDPTRANEGPTSYTFAGWYTDAECTDGNEFVFGNVLESSTTVYAKWDSETLTGYTITYDSQGGSAVSSETVPADGTKFTKPANPTRANDDLYEYLFHNWYKEPECYNKFDFSATPTGNVTAYAGWGKKANKPSGYKTIDPKYNAGTWATEYTSKYQAININTRGTIDTGTSYPAMNWDVSSTGSSTSGMKYDPSNSAFLVNNTTMTIRIVDPQKYFSGFRIEFYVTTWNSESAKTITLTSGGVVSASGISPYDSLDHSDLVLVGNCESKPQEFTFSLGDVGSTGVRLRYIYATFGTFTNDEMAINYATAFNDANVCGTDANDGVNDSKWEAQEAAYDLLPDEVKAIFADYNGDNAEILECLERYNRVVYLHGASYDFMNRIESAGIAVLSKIDLYKIAEDTNGGLMIVIAVISGLMLAASAAFVIKKIKEQ